MPVIGVGTTHNMGGKNGDKQTQERTWQDRRGMKREESTVKADGEQTRLLGSYLILMQNS